MENSFPNAEWIDKAEIASRQLAEAVRLFFEQRDPIVIHTIIASAHQILFDLGKERGIHSALKHPPSQEKKEVRDYFSAINYAYNFFKHADTDGSIKINMAPLMRFTSDFIMDVAWMLQQLNGKLPLEGKVYWAWFASKYKEEFPDDGEIGRMKNLNLGELDFKDICAFLRIGGFLQSTSEKDSR